MKNAKDTKLIAQNYCNMVHRLFYIEDSNNYSKNWDHVYLGLLSELGELADAYKCAYYKKLPLDVDNVLEELGDLAFYKVADSIISIDTSHNAQLDVLTNEVSDCLSNIDSYIGTNNIVEIILSITLDIHQQAPLDYIFDKLHAIAVMHGSDIFDVLERNTRKLTDPKKGRYPAGKFSLDAAIIRNDKMRGC